MKCRKCGKRITDIKYRVLGVGKECIEKMNGETLLPENINSIVFLKKKDEIFSILSKEEFVKNSNMNFDKVNKHLEANETLNFKLINDKNGRINKKSLEIDEKTGKDVFFESIFNFSNIHELIKKNEEIDKFYKKQNLVDLKTKFLLKQNPDEILGQIFKDKVVTDLPFSDLIFISETLPIYKEVEDYIHDELGISKVDEEV